MKTIDKYITEKLKLRKSTYNYQPKTRDKLLELINFRIKSEGPNCDLNDIDTSKITDMSRLFSFSGFCGNISNWDVSNVTDMTSMFTKTYDIKELDLSGWDFSNVTNITTMFANSSIEHLHLNNTLGDKLNTVNGAFMGCSDMAELTGIENLITTRNDVENLTQLFYGCRNIEQLDLSGWNTKNITIFDRVFFGMKIVKEIKGIENFDFTNAKTIGGILYNCKELDADLSNWKLNKANKTKTIEAFRFATKIKQNILSK